MSAQAVGGAVGHNPISIVIPCHRVVGAGGSLTGYAGGVEKKLRLLTLEGVSVEGLSIPLTIINNGKLVIAGREFNSRLFLGTGKFNNNALMAEAIKHQNRNGYCCNETYRTRRQAGRPALSYSAEPKYPAPS